MFKLFVKKNILSFFLFFFFFQGFAFLAVALQSSEGDALLALLLRKGVLSEEEVAEVRSEIKAADKGSRSSASLADSQTVTKGESPFDFSGNLRLRVKNQEKSSKDTTSFRLRALLKGTCHLSDKMFVSGRISTGGSNPRSSDIIFKDGFSGKEIKIDHAFLNYSPCENWHFRAGKFGRDFSSASTMLWDSDLSYEGISLKGTIYSKESFDIGTYMSLYLLDQEGEERVGMYLFQPSFRWQVQDDMCWKFSIGYLGLDNLKDLPLSDISDRLSVDSGNTLDAHGQYLLYDYDALILSSVWGFASRCVPWVSLKAEFTETFDEDAHDKKAYMLGLELGEKSCDAKGDWKFYYEYRDIKPDSFFSGLLDSDFGGGKTGVRGSKLALKYTIADEVFLTFTYLDTESMKNDEKERLFMSDIVVNF
ncbi:hypothetical protein AB834_04930 [PVC group bacterium (ex Bugula neritina AB1)]|nr:hypothetical protein AB834_04930 [PVC group bacterium (ex Bugula neritina AB1)]